MAMALTRKQTPEMAGISPEQVEALKKAGGSITLPDAKVYVRLESVQFPKARHVQLIWGAWPDRKSAQERTGQCVTQAWLICPEPNVLEREIQAEDGTILEPAKVLPTFDEFMGMASPVAESATAGTVADNVEAIKAAAYKIAATWPDFAGAEKV